MQKEEIYNLIKGLIERTTEVSGDILITEEGNNKTTTWFSIETKTPHLFLNRDGEALIALNHLARKILESKMYPSPEISIDINGYQKKKIENIKSIVHMMAERARYFKANMEIEPMSAYERRIVHEFLADATDLKTESVGVGSARRVVIKYTGTI